MHTGPSNLSVILVLRSQRLGIFGSSWLASPISDLWVQLGGTDSKNKVGKWVKKTPYIPCLHAHPHTWKWVQHYVSGNSLIVFVVLVPSKRLATHKDTTYSNYLKARRVLLCIFFNSREWNHNTCSTILLKVFNPVPFCCCTTWDLLPFDFLDSTTYSQQWHPSCLPFWD